MPNLDTMIAPRALTSREVAEVAATELIIYALAHRAFTHARIWLEDETEDATRTAAELALASVAQRAEESVLDWLGDCSSDGEPRFFQKHGLGKAIRDLCSAAASIACKCEGEIGVNLFVRNLEDRDPDTIAHVIGVADDE